MKKSIISLVSAVAVLSACNWKVSPVASEGYLCFDDSSLMLDTEVLTKAAVEAGGNYSIFIYDSDNTEVVSTTYSAVKSKGGKISLPEGSYTVEARSTSEAIPSAAFEQPVYGTSKSFSISAGAETPVGSLVCTLLQTKVTVSYNDEFLSMVTGPGAATVSVASDSPLTYGLTVSDGVASYEQSAGYFAVNNGASTTMEVTFKGSIEGKSQKMTKVFSNVQPKTWHQIKFIRKVNQEGNADIAIVIDGLVDDDELLTDIDPSEKIIGDDPDAPAGDGGIKLESTCGIDIYSPIVVPAEGNPFTLTMKATVPDKVKKFTVEVQSDNSAFVSAVALVNDGSSVLDLVNPSSGAIQVFSEILPFPYGEAVYDKDVIDFDLSDAQTPILAFTGTHTFVMKVVDQKGCKKEISIQMVVE